VAHGPQKSGPKNAGDKTNLKKVIRFGSLITLLLSFFAKNYRFHGIWTLRARSVYSGKAV